MTGHVFAPREPLLYDARNAVHSYEGCGGKSNVLINVFVYLLAALLPLMIILGNSSNNEQHLAGPVSNMASAPSAATWHRRIVPQFATDAFVRDARLHAATDQDLNEDNSDPVSPKLRAPSAASLNRRAFSLGFASASLVQALAAPFGVALAADEEGSDCRNNCLRECLADNKETTNGYTARCELQCDYQCDASGSKKSSLITSLVKKSKENKEKRYAETLDSYNSRNFESYFQTYVGQCRVMSNMNGKEMDESCLKAIEWLKRNKAGEIKTQPGYYSSQTPTAR